MSELKRFVALQARLYAFLDQQDEPTLQALASGAAQLAVVGAGSASALPTRQELLRMTKDELQGIARSRKVPRFSSLTKTKLVDLLLSHEQHETDATVSEPDPPAPAPPARAPAPHAPVPAPSSPAKTASAPPAAPPKPDVDAAAIALRLRETETEEEGAEYLHAQGLDREGLLAVAAELQLTRVSRLKPVELEKKVLKQAIGARRKFAGLSKW